MAVVVLLPPANVKVRAFVPEPRIGAIHVGDAATVRIDGVPDEQHGTVTFVSPRAEYTPPVIYSYESRQKLVFMIEIRFADETAALLHPGQPVDVRIGTR
jgi:HlyD family secretion protein